MENYSRYEEKKIKPTIIKYKCILLNDMLHAFYLCCYFWRNCVQFCKMGLAWILNNLQSSNALATDLVWPDRRTTFKVVCCSRRCTGMTSHVPMNTRDAMYSVFLLHVHGFLYMFLNSCRSFSSIEKKNWDEERFPIPTFLTGELQTCS